MAPLIASGRQVVITSGDQALAVVEVGGGIRAYTVGGQDVLDGYGEDEMCPSARGQLLVPWPNRLAGGTYEVDGVSLQVPLTEPEMHNAIHGLVRFANWVVAEQGPGRVVMAHRLHPQSGYPFLLDLAVEYRLDDEGLTVALTATNRGYRPCPFGAGAHPYLRLGAGVVDDVVLIAPAATYYASDGEGIPIGHEAVEGTEFDFRQGRRLGSAELNTAYTDLARDDDGRFTVELSEAGGDRTVSLWLGEGYPYLMLFTGDTLPDEARRRRGLGVEPMTCAPNAFRSGDGLVMLDPGATTHAAWGITTTGFCG